MKPQTDNTAEWLAREIFKAYPRECPGLKVYELDCGCIYYRRVFRDGSEDEQIGIYRNPARGACEVCMSLPKEWGHRVIEETLVYNTGVVVRLWRASACWHDHYGMRKDTNQELVS